MHLGIEFIKKRVNSTHAFSSGVGLEVSAIELGCMGVILLVEIQNN